MSRLTKAALQEETKEGLLKIANAEMGLGLKSTMRKHEIINFILHNLNRSGITDRVEVVDESVVKNTTNQDLKVGEAIIRLDKSPSNPNGRPVYVGASSNKKQRNALIPVGKPVRVHEIYLEPLSTAVRMEIYQDPMTLDEEEREVHNYPFSVLRHNPSESWIRRHGTDYDIVG